MLNGSAVTLLLFTVTTASCYVPFEQRQRDGWYAAYFAYALAGLVGVCCCCSVVCMDDGIPKDEEQPETVQLLTPPAPAGNPSSSTNAETNLGVHSTLIHTSTGKPIYLFCYFPPIQGHNSIFSKSSYWSYKWFNLEGLLIFTSKLE